MWRGMDYQSASAAFGARSDRLSVDGQNIRIARPAMQGLQMQVVSAKLGLSDIAVAAALGTTRNPRGDLAWRWGAS